MKKIKYYFLPTVAIMVFLPLFSDNAFALPGDDPTSPVSEPVQFENPIEYDRVEDLLGNVLDVVQGIIATLAVLMIVVGGIIYITSAGDQGRVDLAKKAVTAAIIGLAIAIAAPTFLFEIYNVLGATDTPEAAATATPLSQIIFNVLEVLLGIIGTLSVLMLVIGGILYLTSAGDQTRVDTARKTIQYAIVGLIVALIALVIVSQIADVFGSNNTGSYVP